MDFAIKANEVFDACIAAYHKTDDIDAPRCNPWPDGSPEGVLWDKCWIDAVQWHLEDLIRDPEIKPEAGMALKRRIDASNQHRTDMVEDLDSYFRDMYAGVKPDADATINTESPAWAIDRLSILALKIWHMREQTERADAEDSHRAKCMAKLAVLLEQRSDLTEAINTLLEDYRAGRKYMKIYRQMKMYNDVSTNPVLYGKGK